MFACANAAMHTSDVGMWIKKAVMMRIGVAAAVAHERPVAEATEFPRTKCVKVKAD